MSRSVWMVVASGGVLVASSSVVCANQTASSRGATRGGAISGHVVAHSAARSPINRAVVVLVQRATPTRSVSYRNTTTDAQGHFDFSDLASGEYRLEAWKGGYLTAEYGWTEPGGAGTPITLAAGATRADLVISMVRGAAVAGVVSDGRGTPVPNALVRAGAKQAYTNDRGEYRIYGLAPGDYTISATVSGAWREFPSPASVMTASEVEALLTALEQTRTGSTRPMSAPSRPTLPALTISESLARAPVYYPGTVSQDMAAVVTLTEAEERLGLDFPLVSGGTVRIRGTVFAEDGSVIGQTVVWASATGGTRQRRMVTTAADGTFDFANLSPGRYELDAYSRSRPTRSKQATQALTPGVLTGWASMTVDANSGDVDHVDLHLVRGLTFAGRVSLDPPSAVSLNGHVRLVRVGAGPGVAGSVIASDGRFRLTGIGAGTYRLDIDVSVAAGWWLRAAIVDGRDWLDRPIIFGAGSTSPNDVQIVLSTRHTSLTGLVRPASGEAASNCHVIVFPADPKLWNATSRRIASTRPATDGTFAFRDLPPGEYLVAAVPQPVRIDADPQVVLGQLVSSALKVAVLEGEETRQDLQLGPR